MTRIATLWSEQAHGLFVGGACAKPSSNGQRPDYLGTLGATLEGLQSQKR